MTPDGSLLPGPGASAPRAPRKGKTHCGGAFRFGPLKVAPADLLLIAEAMGCADAFGRDAP